MALSFDHFSTIQIIAELRRRNFSDDEFDELKNMIELDVPPNLIANNLYDQQKVEILSELFSKYNLQQLQQLKEKTL